MHPLHLVQKPLIERRQKCQSTQRNFFPYALLLLNSDTSCGVVIAHVAGSMNTAGDFLSRTEVDPTEKLEMALRNDIHTKAIEVIIQSSGIVEEEQIVVLPDEEID